MIRVLVVDDSAVVRKVLTRELNAQEGIEVVGTAMDPFVARDRIAALRPDVLTLDIEMPRMDGLTFLGRLMEHYPLPVVVLSSLTPKNSETALRALALGAVDVAHKPTSQFSVPEVIGQLARSIRAAAYAKVSPRKPPAAADRPQGVLHTTNRVAVIGASTGGVAAIEHFLAALPPGFPGTLVVQHMPVGFTAPFAARLDAGLRLDVREAVDGEPIGPGQVRIAPAGRHAGIVRHGATYMTRLKDGPAVNRFRPSVDVLFQSAAKNAGPNAVGIILTGMGDDGARGLLAMRNAGARTFAEHESSCTVYGMPKAAIELGAASDIAPLDELPRRVVTHLSRTSSAANPPPPTA